MASGRIRKIQSTLTDLLDRILYKCVAMANTNVTDERRLLEMDGDADMNYGTAVEEETAPEKTILYPVHTAPNPLLWPVFALQYLLLIIPAILAGAVLLADQLGVGDQPHVRSEFFSLGLFTAGLSTIMQILAGCRLPTLEGTNTVYIVVIAALIQSADLKDGTPHDNVLSNTTETATEQWKYKMPELQGNLLLASSTHFLLGVTGITGFLLRFIGPMTLAPTIILVGVSLSEYMLPLCAQQWGIAAFAVVLVFLFSLMLAKVTIPVPVIKKKFSTGRFPLFQLNAVILAVGLAWLLCHVLTMTDVLPRNPTMYGHMARTDVRNNVLYTSPWFYIPRPFQYGRPTFSAPGYAGMLTVNLITIMELIGGYFAIARVTDTVPPPVHAVNRGIAVSALSCVLCGIFGNVLGSVPHLTFLGCAGVTKVCSRAVFLTAACVLILGGVVGKVGAALTLIPDPVIGGVNLIAMGMLASVGISLLHHVDLSSTRNLMIIGTCLVLGLKIPEWMAENPGFIQTGNEEVNRVLTVMLSTPMCVTGVVGCLLDNITPGTKEERGIAKWRESNAGPSGSYTTNSDIYEIPYLTSLLAKLKCCVFCPISPTYDEYADARCSSCQCVSRASPKPNTG